MEKYGRRGGREEGEGRRERRCCVFFVTHCQESNHIVVHFLHHRVDQYCNVYNTQDLEVDELVQGTHKQDTKTWMSTQSQCSQCIW